MLNRLYIVLGSLLILLISFAFVAPFFIDWSDRRPQIEALATEALGTPVHVSGDIDIQFLPQPRVTLNGISVGPEQAPVATISHVEADFSLTDFLRDRYSITRLAIGGADISLRIDENGEIDAPINLPETVNASNISVANAELTGSAISLTDARSGYSWRFGDIAGSLAMAGLRGPFGFNATGTYDDRPYQVRLNTSQMNDAGDFQVALFLRATDGGFSLNTDGLFSAGDEPSYAGNLSFRHPPPAQSDSVRGNMVLEAAVDANTERARLTNYVIVPDENRAGTRLTGAAQVDFGEVPTFNATISGGVVALAPRDARTASDADPYELVRLLSELPPPPVPPMPGEVHVDISELDIRAAALREVRADASTDGEEWTISTFEGRLPGDSKFALSGTFGRTEDDMPWARGQWSLGSDRLDALVQLWRPPDERTPLFGLPLQLASDFSLANGALFLSDGAGQIDGADFGFSGVVPPPGGQFDLTASLDLFGPEQSAVLMASLPEITADPAFVASFSGGSFDVSAERLTLYDMPGRKLAARGTWSSTGVAFEHLSAESWGGSSFNLSGGYGIDPESAVTASGRIILERGAAQGLLPFLYEQAGVAPAVAGLVSRNLPASLDVTLASPEGGAAQALDVSGRLGDAALQLAVNLTKGLLNGLSAPMGARATLSSDSPAGLAAALGVDLPLDDQGSASATLRAEGNPQGALDTEFTFLTPGDKLQFTGSVIAVDPDALTGRGKLEFSLSQPSDWGGLLGAGDLYLPALSGVSELRFDGVGSISLSALNADAGGTSVRGDLSRSLDAGTPLYSGSLTLGGVDIAGFPALLAGGAALLDLEGGVWPDGPFASSEEPRDTRGRISVNANGITGSGRALAGATSFDLVWDDRNTRLRGGSVKIGGGTLSFDVGVCCSGTPGPRHVAGRMGLDGVRFDALVPEAPAASIDAELSGALQFDATGDTIAALVATLAGQGSFSARNLVINGFDPGAFATIAKNESLIDMDAAQLTDLVAGALSSGPFTADQIDGVLSLAGGTLRADNLSAGNTDSELYGGVSFNLTDLGLAGSWTLAPSGPVGDGGLINQTTARIGAVLSGTLFAPELRLDLAQMVDTIQVRAYELEVERLEKLRAEDEARSRAAAEERARLMALEAKRQAEEAAAKAEAEAKARAEAEAKAKAEAEAKAAEQQMQDLIDQNNLDILDQLNQDLGITSDGLGQSQDPLVAPDVNEEVPLDLLGPTIPDQPIDLNSPSVQTLN